MIVAGEPFGAVYLAEKLGGGGFSEEDEAIVVALSRLAAATVVNQRLIASARAWAEQLEALRQVSDSVVAGVGTTELLGLVVRHFRSLVEAEGASLGLFEPDGTYRVAASEGRGAAFMLEHSPPILPRLLRTLRADQCVRLDSVVQEPEFDPLAAREIGSGACLLAPLLIDGRMCGVLSALDKVGGGGFSDADQRMAEVFAHRTTIALELSERFSRSSVEALVEAQESERRRLGAGAPRSDRSGADRRAADASPHRHPGGRRRRDRPGDRRVARVDRRGDERRPPPFRDPGAAGIRGGRPRRRPRIARDGTGGADGSDDPGGERRHRGARRRRRDVVPRGPGVDHQRGPARGGDDGHRRAVVRGGEDGPSERHRRRKGARPGDDVRRGMSGMRERARLARGSMSVGRSPEGGAMVAVQLPLP